METLDLLDSIGLLRKNGVPFVEFVKVSSEGELEAAAGTIGFPLVMKIVSKQHSHKTDVGGVAVGLNSLGEVREAYGRMSKVSKDVLLQRQADGYEVIIGVKKDKVFGRTVMFGMGGVFVEVYKDVSFRLCPVDKEEALKMIRETKASRILEGFRGKPPADIGKIAELIVKVSKIDVEELDINPVMAGKDAVPVDARIVLG